MSPEEIGVYQQLISGSSVIQTDNLHPDLMALIASDPNVDTITGGVPNSSRLAKWRNYAKLYGHINFHDDRVIAETEHTGHGYEEIYVGDLTDKYSEEECLAKILGARHYNYGWELESLDIHFDDCSPMNLEILERVLARLTDSGLRIDYLDLNEYNLGCPDYIVEVIKRCKVKEVGITPTLSGHIHQSESARLNEELWGAPQEPIPRTVVITYKRDIKCPPTSLLLQSMSNACIRFAFTLWVDEYDSGCPTMAEYGRDVLHYRHNVDYVILFDECESDKGEEPWLCKESEKGLTNLVLPVWNQVGDYRADLRNSLRTYIWLSEHPPINLQKLFLHTTSCKMYEMAMCLKVLLSNCPKLMDIELRYSSKFECPGHPDPDKGLLNVLEVLLDPRYTPKRVEVKMAAVKSIGEETAYRVWELLAAHNTLVQFSLGIGPRDVSYSNDLYDIPLSVPGFALFAENNRTLTKLDMRIDSCKLVQCGLLPLLAKSPILELTTVCNGSGENAKLVAETVIANRRRYNQARKAAVLMFSDTVLVNSECRSLYDRELQGTLLSFCK